MSLPRSVAAAVERIKSETVRGASWALLEASRGILESIENGEKPCGRAEDIARAVHEANPTMVPLEWVSYTVRTACDRGGESALSEALRRLVDYQSRARRRLVEEGRFLLEDVRLVSVYSYSSSVELLLRAVPAARRPAVIVHESRPGGEGVFFARVLRDSGFNVRLVPDVLMYESAKLSDLVLVGADAVTLDGCIFNKVGTRLLAVSARDSERPLVAVFDATKVSPTRSCEDHPITTREYVIEGYGAVEYPLFDSTPVEYFAGFITEKGFLEARRESLARLVESLKEYLQV